MIIIKRERKESYTYLCFSFDALACVSFVAVFLQKMLQRLVSFEKNHRLLLLLLQNTLHICSLLLVSSFFFVFSEAKHS